MDNQKIYTLLIIILIIILIVIIFLIIYNNKKSNSNSIKVKDINIISPLPMPIPTSLPFPSPIKYKYYAKSWNTISPSGNLSFPEFYSSNLYGNKVPDINKVSIGLTGAGPRSFCANIGFFRALERMGYKNKAQYVASSSGSSWFYSLYSYYQTYGNVDIALGKSCGLDNNIPNPSLMTLNELKTTNLGKKDFGNLFTNKTKFNQLIIKFLLPNSGVEHNDLWNALTREFILKPFGLDKNVPIALNKKHADDIYKRNSSLGYPLYLKDNMPFWLCNSTLLFNYLHNYPYLAVSLTPLYSGITQKITIDNNTIGGMVIENFAFGNSSIPDNLPINNEKPVLNAYTISNIRNLSDSVGTSSFSPAEFFFSPIFIPYVGPYIKDITEFLSEYYLLGTAPLSMTNSDSQCDGCKVPNGYDINSCTRVNNTCYSNTAKQCDDGDCELSSNGCKNKTNNSSLNCSFSPLKGCYCNKNKYPPYVNNNPKQDLYLQKSFLSDGAIGENTGVLSLLSRGVKSIICFCNAGVLRRDSPGYCESNISPLFGAEDCKVYHDNVKVFNKDDYNNNIKVQFNKTLDSGGPIFARASLNVLNNEDYNISSIDSNGNPYVVDILFVCLELSLRFLHELPEEVRSQIGPDENLLFANFPIFSYIMQTSPYLLYYTLEQVNLLSSYTDWCLNQPELKVHVDEMFSY